MGCLFAWLGNFRWLVVRYKYHASYFWGVSVFPESSSRYGGLYEMYSVYKREVRSEWPTKLGKGMFAPNVAPSSS